MGFDLVSIEDRGSRRSIESSGSVVKVITVSSKTMGPVTADGQSSFFTRWTECQTNFSSLAFRAIDRTPHRQEFCLRTNVVVMSLSLFLRPAPTKVPITFWNFGNDDKKDDDDDGSDAFATCSRQGPRLSPWASFQALLYHYQSIPHRSHPDS